MNTGSLVWWRDRLYVFSWPCLHSSTCLLILSFKMFFFDWESCTPTTYSITIVYRRSLLNMSNYECMVSNKSSKTYTLFLHAFTLSLQVLFSFSPACVLSKMWTIYAFPMPHDSLWQYLASNCSQFVFYSINNGLESWSLSLSRSWITVWFIWNTRIRYILVMYYNVYYILLELGKGIFLESII